jgi:UDP-2,4-diacetamido-2,4,6-trideoxy-beta-L-altropyranose hydrolase
MLVVFRVDSSSNIGAGHLMRCLALASELRKEGKTIKFICRNLKGSLIEEIKYSGFSAIELEMNTENKASNNSEHLNFLEVTQQQDAKDCIKVLKRLKVDLLIVDHYGIGEDWHIYLQNYCEKLMVIDDLANRKYRCDILLDQTYKRRKEEYNGLVQRQCKLLLGPKYALLRSEFLKWREYSLHRRINSEFKKILITMGGADMNNVTEKVLIALEKSLPNNIEITVLMMKSMPYIENVMERARVMSCNTVVKINATNIAEIISNSDIVIGASGTSSMERFCLGVPSIQFSIAKNQNFSSKSFAEDNLVKLVTEVEQIHNLLVDPEVWMSDISNASSKICDGFGSQRILENI